MDLKKILGNIGCTALGTIAPPFGGMAANVLKSVLGLKKGSTDNEVLQAVSNATPEQLIAIKDADHKFKLDMEKLNVNILELDKEDRNSARKMQVTTKSLIPAILSIVITAGFFGVLYIMLINGVPDGEKDVLHIMVGVLGTAWIAIVNYWFGSSSGSKEKTNIMGNK